ncbi:MAG TPA: hypothetical protein PKI15_04425 [Candidatus Cloacimonadota bacterium]|nr:hypothetical protein [Candidatus Cloacimonadota bacterium]
MVSPSEELVLWGDVSKLTNAFAGQLRRTVSCPVPESVYLKLQQYPGGVSRFIEDAVESFNGDLNALVVAAVDFVNYRKQRAPQDPSRNASGRLLPSSMEKIQMIQAALSSIRGVTRAKIIAGLIQLHLV